MDQGDGVYRTLLDLFVRADHAQAVALLLAVLCTDKEQRELRNRLCIFALLARGVTQREIAERLGVGIATVSRGAKVYQQYDLGNTLPMLKYIDLEAK